MSDNSNIERQSPQRLLEGFAKGKVIRCVLAAIVIHVIIIGAMSTRYIYLAWINPDAETTTPAHDDGKATGNGDSTAAARASTNAIAASAKPAVVKPKSSDGTDKAILDKHGDKPAVRKITDAATPDEIPDMPTPGGLGISLDDTN